MEQLYFRRETGGLLLTSLANRRLLLNEVARGEKLSFDSREQKYTRGKVNGKKLLPRLRR